VWVREVLPLIKFVAAVILTAACILLQRPVGLAILGIMLVLLGWQGGLRLSWRLGGALIFMLFSFVVINIAFGTPYTETLRNTLRLGVLLLIGPVLTLTIPSAKLVKALRQGPFPEGLAIALLITWRFIPVLLREARQIRDAARLRGLRWAPGLLRIVFRSMIIPICFQSVSFADHITMALETRGFNLQRSPSLKSTQKVGSKDLIFMALTIFPPLILLWRERALCFG